MNNSNSSHWWCNLSKAHRRPLSRFLALLIIPSIVSSNCARGQSPAGAAVEKLEGTTLITRTDDLSLAMQQDVDRFLVNLTYKTYAREWQDVDSSSLDAYRRSVAEKRQRLMEIIGVVDKRVPFKELDLVVTVDEPRTLLETDHYRVQTVRWPVLEGVHAEGLLLEPRGAIKGQVIALPDADWTPEMLAGCDLGPVSTANYAARLATAGCRVLVPTLVDRNDTWSGNPDIRMLNQPHREFIYRPAFYMGRHIIGYEVQKVLAAVDYFTHKANAEREHAPHNDSHAVGVVGYGEGAMVAFYSAAIDERIKTALVSGYFQERMELWREPIYRNVWSILRDYGDAKLAGLVAPRGLVLEACRGVELNGPPSAHAADRNYAATGRLATPSIETVRKEFARAERTYRSLNVGQNCRLVESEHGSGLPCSPVALQQFLELLGNDTSVSGLSSPLSASSQSSRSAAQTERMKRQVQELVAFNQDCFWKSSRERAEFWRAADSSSLSTWTDTTISYRQHFLDQIIGDWALDPVPANAQSRLLYETNKWQGYEVTLDVAPGLWLYGILLVPNDVGRHEAGSDEANFTQRRPVVVCVHGRGGRPQQVCDPLSDDRAYHRFGAKLADRGFVVFAPQHLYFGEEAYRQIQRKANPLGLSLFSPMIWQHRTLLKWLGEQSFVDPDRIAFYGLSYGGKSALVIPAVLPGYSLSICSGAFSDAVRKHIDAVGGNRSVFLFTGEYEHLEFDVAEKFNHAELAWLISPRPFMVEKGHWDGGLPDEWTAFEFARVRRRYVQLGIGNRTEMELFPGIHEIHAQGTFEFLNRHLRFAN